MTSTSQQVPIVRKVPLLKAFAIAQVALLILLLLTAVAALLAPPAILIYAPLAIADIAGVSTLFKSTKPATIKNGLLVYLIAFCIITILSIINIAPILFGPPTDEILYILLAVWAAVLYKRL